MKRKFDIRFLLLATLFNGVVVFYINLRGGSSEATVAGIVQLFVSAALAGFTGPFAIRSAQLSLVLAFVRGSLLMASGVAIFGGVLHWYFESPNLSGTILWNFFLDLFGGGAIVFFVRNKKRL